MIDRKSLARALARADLADWVVTERDQELAVLDDARRAERRTRWQLVVHADTPGGRGTAHVAIDANEGDPDKVVHDAATLARLSVGPAWASIPQAAAARVELFDPALAALDILDAGDVIVRQLPRRPDVTLDARITLLRERVAVLTHLGFHAEWSATLIRVTALASAGGHALELAREARRADALGLAAALDDARADLRSLAAAQAPPLGPCALVLASDALLHGGLGVWAAFASQADPVVARQGLTRYHAPAPIVPGADQLAEPLTITSDGARPFGVRSAPLGDDGDAVRKFALVARGLAAGLGLSPREAALRKRDPNGGVRNLVVHPGSWDEKPAAPRTLELRRLRGLEIDPYTGDADLELALGIDRETGAPFTGGTVRLDLIAALARARRSARVIQRGAYEGPAAVLIDRAELI